MKWEKITGQGTKEDVAHRENFLQTQLCPKWRRDHSPRWQQMLHKTRPTSPHFSSPTTQNGEDLERCQWEEKKDIEPLNEKIIKNQGFSWFLNLLVYLSSKAVEFWVLESSSKILKPKISQNDGWIMLKNPRQKPSQQATRKNKKNAHTVQCPTGVAVCPRVFITKRYHRSICFQRCKGGIGCNQLLYVCQLVLNIRT